MKKYYELWNIPWTYKDEINLIIKDDCYINEIDADSIFFIDVEVEEINIGQIILEIGNILYIKKNDFFNLFINYKKHYTIPNIGFIKECFNDLIKLGFSQLVAHSIIDGIIYNFKPETTFETAYNETSNKLIEWYNYPVNSIVAQIFEQLNPMHVMSRQYTPLDAVFKTHIIEYNQELLSVCTHLDLPTLINIDALYSRKKNFKILQCHHCKSFFMQTHGNNTKWCKLCASLEYSEKKDIYYQLYRKKQRTMLQRSYRCKDMDSWEYQDRYTTPWENDIKEKIDDYREKNNYLDFEKYITNSMNKYKPSKKGRD